ncbi:hypothetical protein [Thermomonospora cellulosilytica]|uniref:DNA recombination-mediator protein A n=1 Tax=Thermomonospora cellulosilytica TaxID=1411118 RepID=A0A7W3MUI7_9ACTN|nr:hypothetical protein [Thermomonospora cellulosilytica]MBA9002119.1 hypothetical protein [Thermomonospora cellulosilytica]
MPQAVTITGSRSTGHRREEEYGALFATYVRPFALPGVRFYLGGAIGIDSLALGWLARETDVRLSVVVPVRLADQPPEARGVVADMRSRGRLDELVELGGRSGTEGYHARNRWMVDRSDFVIGFPRADVQEGGGTGYTLDYAASQYKPRLIVPI